MYDEIKAKLDEEIMDQLSVLSDMDVGSDKRKTAVDDLVKLYRLRIWMPWSTLQKGCKDG